MFDSGFTTSPAGSGLGLALVHQMAAAHGWDVRAGESETGGGRIEFSIPA